MNLGSVHDEGLCSEVHDVVGLNTGCRTLGLKRRYSDWSSQLTSGPPRVHDVTGNTRGYVPLHTRGIKLRSLKPREPETRTLKEHAKESFERRRSVFLFFVSHPASDCRAPPAVLDYEGRTRGAGEGRGDGRGGMLGADLFDGVLLGS